MAQGAIQSIAIVLGLIAVGGIFVAAEIALISLRESQVKQIAHKGKRGARVFKLTKNPNRFFSCRTGWYYFLWIFIGGTGC